MDSWGLEPNEEKNHSIYTTWQVHAWVSPTWTSYKVGPYQLFSGHKNPIYSYTISAIYTTWPGSMARLPCIVVYQGPENKSPTILSLLGGWAPRYRKWLGN